MKILGKNYEDKALWMGAGLLSLALVIPTVSEPLINFYFNKKEVV